MVQTVCTRSVPAGAKTIILEKPHTSQRIFFSVNVIAGESSWYDTKISFDDPHFRSFYVIDGPAKYFQAEGDDIFQGNIWIYNISDTNLLYSATEILH